MPVYLREIKGFLNRSGVEGPQQLRGYIPCRRMSDGKGRNYIGPIGTDPGEVPYSSTGNPDFYRVMGVSGVTIATGVDFGQTDANTLRRSGLPESLIGAFSPYLALRKDAAIDRLFAFPLIISKCDADVLDGVILGIHAKNIPARYNRDNPSAPFAELPWQAQAAIFALLFQRGTGAAGKAPITWNAFLRGDWQAAADSLCNPSLWDGYQERRKLEGKLLKEIA